MILNAKPLPPHATTRVSYRELLHGEQGDPKNGEIDVAIMALPLPQTGLMMQAVCDEPFIVAIPRHYPWSRRKSIPSEDLKKETMLLLGAGHCFRDQVLEVRRRTGAACSRGASRSRAARRSRRCGWPP